MSQNSTTSPLRGAADWVSRTLDTRRGGATHVDALDGIRGLAVTAVFFVHYHPWVAKYLPPGTIRDISARIADVGNLGVDLFFVLSGFLIYGGLLRRDQAFGSFMQRRLQRLYPTFIVVFIPVLLIELARGGPTLRGGPGPIVNLLGNLSLLAGFLPITPLLVVTWTLSWEIVFYLLTPAAFRLGRLRDRSRPQRMVIVGVVWGVLSLSGAFRGVGNARIIMFLGGVAVAEWVAARAGASQSEVRSTRGLHRWGLVLAVAVPVVCFLLTYGGHLSAHNPDKVVEVAYGSQGWAAWVRLGVLFFCLPVVVASVVEGVGPLAWFTSRPALRYLGTISYSYYLIHGLVIRFVLDIVAHVVPPATHQNSAWWFIALIPVFAATVVVAFFLFALVERPCSIDRDPPVTVIPPRIVRWPWTRTVAV